MAWDGICELRALGGRQLLITRAHDFAEPEVAALPEVISRRREIQAEDGMYKCLSQARPSFLWSF